MTPDEWERNIAHVERIARDMRQGRWKESSEIMVLTRDAETGIITFARIGEGTGILGDAYELHQKWVVSGAQVH